LVIASIIHQYVVTPLVGVRPGFGDCEMKEQGVTPRKNTKRKRKSSVKLDEQAGASAKDARSDEHEITPHVHDQDTDTKEEKNPIALDSPGYERLSAREELIALTDELIAAAEAEQEKKALRATKEELLAVMDSR
jgi:hypothetical protein